MARKQAAKTTTPTNGSQWKPYYPVELKGLKLAFESREIAENFLKRCTTEGTLYTGEDGKTQAVSCLVFREDAPIEDDE